MRFGRVPVSEAAGLVTAHTVRAGGATLRKGRVVTPELARQFSEAGLGDLIAVRLEPGDVGEDAAARCLAERLGDRTLRVAEPFTGRCNLFADEAGVLLVERAAIDALNAVDEAVTAATLPPYRPVVAGEMVATVKVIPYAVAGDVLDRACAAVPEPPLRVAPYRLDRVGVVSTRLPGLKESTIDRTLEVLTERLAPTGARIVAEERVPHDSAAVAEALVRLAREGAELAIVFGASAIADRQDVIPAGIERAGGRVEHLGMPVDPGNLLLVGSLAAVPVIGAPGCARSPKENGFDWVLHRLLAGLAVTRADIVALGVGGLLTEIVSRPQPRAGGAPDEADA
ncbi:molybdopterin-binding protein [Methylobacterium radiodurans]|uniref:Molybdopterin-binding protein n=1 Tax=Methylobacterium radiodurans TaxID=2202828 RepID=A0A2U8VQQ0_9HYPH|nr:molybdopterin-binding protein [Methylobacterium radiodurans]AWN36014.1 molybdopterin-binding protein [Methylobacterium radiodurans]